jgi:hypothetical protein
MLLCITTHRVNQPTSKKIKMREEISYEYIRGLIEGEGSFTFSPNKINGTTTPSFAIRMHIRDKKMITMMRDKLKLKNRIYEYNYQGKDGSHRGPTVTLIVREVGNLKNIIVPLCYKKLVGNKSISFEKWMNIIGADPGITKGYKFINHLYELGFYDNIHDFD